METESPANKWVPVNDESIPVGDGTYYSTHYYTNVQYLTITNMSGTNITLEFPNNKIVWITNDAYTVFGTTNTPQKFSWIEKPVNHFEFILVILVTVSLLTWPSRKA